MLGKHNPTFRRKPCHGYPSGLISGSSLYVLASRGTASRLSVVRGFRIRLCSLLRSSGATTFAAPAPAPAPAPAFSEPRANMRLSPRCALPSSLRGSMARSRRRLPLESGDGVKPPPDMMIAVTLFENMADDNIAASSSSSKLSSSAGAVVSDVVCRAASSSSSPTTLPGGGSRDDDDDDGGSEGWCLMRNALLSSRSSSSSSSPR